MSYRAEITDGQPVEIFGHTYTWRRESGRWSLRRDSLESPRAELTAALTRRAAQAELAELRAARAAALTELPGVIAYLAQQTTLARCAAVAAGDVAYRPPGRFATHATHRAGSWVDADVDADGQAAS